MRNFRKPMHKFNNYNPLYPYKQMLPAALNSEVSAQGKGRRPQVCLSEMNLMLVCLRKYEFDQARCSKEVEGFLSCNQLHEQKVAASKSQPIATTGRLPTDIVNSQLMKYPQPSKTK